MADKEQETSTTNTETVSEEAAQGAEESTPAAEKDSSKITILLNATGNVPILKKRKWVVEPMKTVGSIQQFIHKYLKLDANEQIFLYVNRTFAPSPDQVVKNLYECHASNGQLVLYYCKNQAWG